MSSKPVHSTCISGKILCFDDILCKLTVELFLMIDGIQLVKRDSNALQRRTTGVLIVRIFHSAAVFMFCYHIISLHFVNYRDFSAFSCHCCF